jgi:hypothetical protein
MLAYEPGWYFNRLIAICALFWLFSLIPGALAALEYIVIALKSAATALVFTLAVAARWMRKLELQLMIDPWAPEPLLRSLANVAS